MGSVRSPLGPQEVRERLEAMGIKARLMAGGRCVLASMRLGPEPFETLRGPVRIGHAVFSTVGPDRIKCLRPRALFQLPLLRILDCRDAMSIEARIRVAWQQHLARLRDARAWLERLGVESEPAEQASVLAFPIEGERPGTAAMVVEPRRVILPTRGPLEGIVLPRAEDRVMAVDSGLDSAVDLEIAVSNRLAELRRMAHRLAEERRREALRTEPGRERDDAPEREPRLAKAPGARLLLVGPRIAQDRACIESLRLRGYDVRIAPAESAALGLLLEISPELVMVDVHLGRSEGIELIPSLRRAPGVEELPVVLVDDHRRSARREAARRVGAAGYLVRPIDVPRIAKRLERMIAAPKRRRFTRYPRRISVRVDDRETPWVATTVGRGGMFVSTQEDLPTHSVHGCTLSLPEVGRPLRVEAEVLYRLNAAGESRGRGVGVRFRRFEPGAEPLFIRYLGSLERTSAS